MSDGTAPAGASARGLASPLADEIVRERLIDRLAERWVRTVVTVEAPGGYGKSVALAQAIRDNASDPTGIDIYHACRPPDGDAANLSAAILHQLGAEGLPPSTRAAGELAGIVAGAVATRAPTDVCIVLDDLHHLGEGVSSVELLDRLLRTLPTNGHLLLAGRTLPKLPITRFAAADDLVRLTQDDLIFDRDELAQIAGGHGVDPAVLAATGGWPVMTRLALVAGAGASMDYLFEEVVDVLDDDRRLGLATVVLGRRVDDALLRAVGARCSTGDLMANVPLVLDLGQGFVGAHDLWGDVLHQLIDEDLLRELAAQVARWHREAGRLDDAMGVAAGSAVWSEAKATIMESVGSGDALLTAERMQRWLQMFPQEQQDEPEVCLLRGIASRLSGTPGSGDDDVEAAFAGFHERDQTREYVAAGIEVATRAWHRGDLPRVFEIYVLGEELREQGFPGMDPFLKLVQGGMADLQGEVVRGRDLVAEIDVDSVVPEIAVMALQMVSTFNLQLGETQAAVDAANRFQDYAQNDGLEFQRMSAYWMHGDPEPTRGRWPEFRTFAHDNPRYDFPIRVAQAVGDASYGIVSDLSGMDELLTGRTREDAMLTVAAASAHIAAGREDDARATFASLAERAGAEDLLCRLELRRNLALAYVLSPEFRATFDRDPLGPTQIRRRALGRLFLGARAGEPVDWSTLPPSGEVFCAFPLPWSLELAAHAAAAGGTAHVELAEFISDISGALVQNHLRRIADGGGPAAAGAVAILAAVPAQPSTVTSVRLCGKLDVLRVGGVDSGLLRRSRVRELVALLVLRGALGAEQIIELLWPELPPSRGRNNLRITLSFVRRLLEPDRHAHEASFHIRRRGDDIRLHRSGYLDVDAWAIEEKLSLGRARERDGSLAEAMDCYRSAVERWTDAAFTDLTSCEALEPEVIRFNEELSLAATRVAEWALAHGSTADAIATAERVLRHDPFSERAHGVLVSAHLAIGDLESAEQAVARLEASLAELGVSATPETSMVLRRFERRRRPAAVN